MYRKYVNLKKRRQCRSEFKCCFDQFTEVTPGQNCFKPATPEKPGISPGAAVGITIGVLAAFGGAILCFVYVL